MILRSLPLAALSVLFFATGVLAEPYVSTDGYYRVRGYYLTHPDLDETTKPNVQRYFQHRLRFVPHLFVNEYVGVHLQADAVDDQVWGANPGNVLSQSTSDHQANLVVKRAYGDVTTPVGLVRVGRQGSHWGKGIFSNDGEGLRNEFGDAHFGDTYDRVLFATKPLGKDGPLTTAILYDKIVETDFDIASSFPVAATAARLRGDVDEVGIVLLYKQGNLTAGMYGIYRWQDKTETSAYAPDAYVKYDNGVFHFDLEAVSIFGQSRAVTALFNPDQKIVRKLTLAQPKVDIAMIGAASEVGMRVANQWDFAVEAGYASGDKGGTDAFVDGKLTAFSFDPDYNVGLLMFEEAYRLYTLNKLLENRNKFFNVPIRNTNATSNQICALTCDNLTEFATREAAIADFWNNTANTFVPSNGAVKNAVYAFPKVRYQPSDSVKMVLGVLWARANEPVQTRVVRDDPKTTLTTEFETASDYGFEVDYAINYSYTANFHLGLQAGWFRPGTIFKQPDRRRAPNMFLVQPRFTVTF